MVGFLSRSLQGQFKCTSNLCCIFFEYSLLHALEGTSGIHVLTRTVPASISRARSFACTVLFPRPRESLALVSMFVCGWEVNCQYGINIAEVLL